VSSPDHPVKLSNGNPLFPYWLLFSVFALGALQAHRTSRDGEDSVGLLLLAAGFFTVLMIGFRYEVGGDWNSYYRALVMASYESFADIMAGYDPGYAILNWLSATLGFDIWLVNFLCGILFVWGLLQFAKRQPNPWLCVLVAVPYLIIVVAMGYTRQAVAIGILLAGLSDLDRRNSVLRFLFYVAVAGLFHKTAIIVLPLIIMATARRKIVIVPVALMTLILLYYLLLSSEVESIRQGYVEVEYSSQGAAVRVALNLVPAALFFLFQSRFGFSELAEKVWRNFAVASFVLLFLLFATPSSTAIDRMALYLIPLQLVIFSHLPNVFGKGGSQNGQVVLGVIVYSALVQLVWLTQGVFAELWLPYKVFPLFG
jgi:hypothetical protein